MLLENDGNRAGYALTCPVIGHEAIFAVDMYDVSLAAWKLPGAVRVPRAILTPCGW